MKVFKSLLNTLLCHSFLFDTTRQCSLRLFIKKENSYLGPHLIPRHVTESGKHPAEHVTLQFTIPSNNGNNYATGTKSSC